MPATKPKRSGSALTAAKIPAAEKRKRREAPTIQDLLDRYIEDHLPNKACYGTWRERDERKMLDLIGDGLGRKSKVADIHVADIEKLHRAITKANGPIRANRTIEIASKCFSMAMTPLSGEREPWRSPALGNPCKGVKRNPEDGQRALFQRGRDRGHRRSPRHGGRTLIGGLHPAHHADGMPPLRGDARPMGRVR